MKKSIFSILLLNLGFSVFAQIPQGYYDAATGTSYTLKTQLHEIIKTNHVDRTYNGLKDLYKSTDPLNGFRDKYYENDNTVLDIYSENPTGRDPYNYIPGDNLGAGQEGGGYNREHLVPQSFFDEYRTNPMRTDAFHVWPTDGKVNGWRSNFAFGEVVNRNSASACNSGATNTPCKSLNGTTKGKYVYNDDITVVEPIDEFKGDIARAILYFTTRYEDMMPDFYRTTRSNSKVMFDGSRDKAISDEFLSQLLTWHVQDPVSQRELDINNLIYNYQGNRNPFIDNPEYAQRIWGTLSSTDFNYQERPDINVINTNNNSVIVELKNNDKKIDKVMVYNMNGQMVQENVNQYNQNKLEVKFQSKGIYIIKIVGNGLEVNRKVVIK
ncbi:endonuclease [Faecalibacter bovis]|uniref:Endonuclease n=1 Tax=Faecalibacter bovis TaxID=2898187 RepID=A0ABX7XBP6_9FLAO|nr:endonuclease [Faecalibacter bovis]QTV05326.1 endonuclease [Faecalibacter bovis]